MIVTFVFDISPDGYIINVLSETSFYPSALKPCAPQKDYKRYVAKIEVPDPYEVEESKVLEVKSN